MTAAAGGPTLQRRSTISSTAVGSPEKRASTEPSLRLRTQPLSPSSRAVWTVQSRKNTPCTRPLITTRSCKEINAIRNHQMRGEREREYSFRGRRHRRRRCGGGDGVHKVSPAAACGEEAKRKNQRRDEK